MLGQYFDILVLLVVVLVIFQRLRMVLGTRPSESEKKAAEENAAKLFDMLMKEAEQKQSHMAGRCRAGCGNTGKCRTHRDGQSS